MEWRWLENVAIPSVTGKSIISYFQSGGTLNARQYAYLDCL